MYMAGRTNRGIFDSSDVLCVDVFSSMISITASDTTEIIVPTASLLPGNKNPTDQL
jgi:hypothetical protein